MVDRKNKKQKSSDSEGETFKLDLDAARVVLEVTPHPRRKLDEETKRRAKQILKELRLEEPNETERTNFAEHHNDYTYLRQSNS